MKIKNYTTVNLDDLQAMKAAGNEIASEIKLAHSSAKALKRLQDCPNAKQAVPHFKAIVNRYYRSQANLWLEENGYLALPSKFDYWEDIQDAATCHVMEMAGIKVWIYNGWFEVANW
jgi:hypothetical protein